MKDITLHKQWVVKAPIEDVARIVTDFEKLPKYFPQVAESVDIKKRDGNNLEMEATVKSFGKRFQVKMKTQILPGKGFISDNDSYQFGTSGHEELLLSEHPIGLIPLLGVVGSGIINAVLFGLWHIRSIFFMPSKKGYLSSFIYNSIYCPNLLVRNIYHR